MDHLVLLDQEVKEEIQDRKEQLVLWAQKDLLGKLDPEDLLVKEVILE